MYRGGGGGGPFENGDGGGTLPKDKKKTKPSMPGIWEKKKKESGGWSRFGVEGGKVFFFGCMEKKTKEEPRFPKRRVVEKKKSEKGVNRGGGNVH